MKQEQTTTTKCTMDVLTGQHYTTTEHEQKHPPICVTLILHQCWFLLSRWILLQNSINAQSAKDNILCDAWPHLYMYSATPTAKSVEGMKRLLEPEKQNICLETVSSLYGTVTTPMESPPPSVEVPSPLQFVSSLNNSAISIKTRFQNVVRNDAGLRKSKQYSFMTSPPIGSLDRFTAPGRSPYF